MKTVLFDPHPRTPELLFSETDWRDLNSRYRLLEPPVTNDQAFYQKHISETDYIIGQPDLDTALLARAKKLKAVINVESNFLDNMDYHYCFEQGIHVLATSPVFAMPVAEMGLGLALSLLRDIPANHHAFTAGEELYGLESNQRARLITGSRVGMIGYGDLGAALHLLLRAFRCEISVFDPWLPDSLITDAGACPESLDDVFRHSDLLFIVAAATTTNQGYLGTREFNLMNPGASVVLLSRAGVVNFPDLLDAVGRGHIRAATDVFPTEPVPADDPIRKISGLLLSAHRAGAISSAFTEMGRIVLADMKLIDEGLVPKLCKRAERETVGRFRSKPVDMN